MSQVELSIVIPILNETSQLPELLADLQRQQQVGFELLIVDGGSDDGGPEWLQTQMQGLGLRGSVLTSPRGRGRQLHLGALQAKGEWLLFLHADSRFADPLAFRKALNLLQQAASERLAGHFALTFRRTAVGPSAGYYYYEWKARLGRPETIHGDQGFLLRRIFYQQLDGFRVDLPVMEDTDFAERLRAIGQWQLLPAEISTSARRFETEGLWQRQLLGALIMCFRSIGYDQFVLSAPGIYRQQDKTDKLQMRPFFDLIRKLFAEMGPKAAWQIWWLSGCYIRRHAWQLAFALDARRSFRLGIPVGKGRATLTETFEPIYDLLTDNFAGRCVATVILRLWFEVTRLWLTIKEPDTQGS
jgi:rSAM/selenodomain-associated transferase 2